MMVEERQWTRRHFLSVSSTALVAGLFFPRVAGARSQATGMRELRRNVGIFTARGGTIGWLIDPSGIAVVDSQYAQTAPQALAGIRERSQRRIDVLINTHHHGDHTGGNGVLRDITEHIVAQRRVVELQRAAAGERADELTYADTLFDRDWTLSVGDETITARHYMPAHTGGDCTVLFERAEIVHMGDLVFNRAWPFIDRDGGASVRGWIAALEAIASEHPARTLYVFGHVGVGAPVTGSRAEVLLQRDLLSGALDIAQRAMSAGRSREEVVAIDAIPGFPDHTSISARLNAGATIGAAYDELSSDTSDPKG
jgi:cyclase